MINEFTAKKLGEVLAFADVGRETLTQGKEAFVSVFGTEEVEAMQETISQHRDAINAIADEAHVLEIVLAKLESTSKKLRAMRDLYVGDQWNNATELLEWSGFFEGAAVVHWALVSGVAEETGNAALRSLSTQALSLHKELLKRAEDYLHRIGTERAK